MIKNEFCAIRVGLIISFFTLLFLIIICHIIIKNSGQHGKKLIMDEYTVLNFFIAGILFQALMITRSFEGVLTVTALTLISFIAASYLADVNGDNRFEIALMSILFFLLGFAAFYHDKIMPLISIRTLIHYTLLFYYTVWLHISQAEIAMPLSIIITGLVPAVCILGITAFPRLHGKAIKLLSYVWFLIVLTTIIVSQFSIEDVKGIVEQSGFSGELFTYSFFAGTAFLYFFSNLLFLLLLIPAPRRRNVLMDAIFGNEKDISKEFAESMTKKMIMERLSLISLFLIIAHATLLFANIKFEYISHGLLINISIAGIVWVSMIPGSNNKIEGDCKTSIPS